MGEVIDIRTLDENGLLPVYRAVPDDAPRAAVVVIQEIFGLNPGIRAKADRWAELGYLALAPDMFWRFAPGLQLDPDQPDDLQQAFGHIKRFDVEAGVQDIAATIRWARTQIGGGKVGVVGFCLGGRMAFLAATRTDADASVGYYGGAIPGLLHEAHAIGRPLMLHFGEEDSHIPPEQVEQIRTALADRPGTSIYSYAGAGHGFATTTGSRRHDAAARQADSRTEALLAEALA